MTKKPVGLAQFTNQAEQPPDTMPRQRKAKAARGEREIVVLSTRVQRDDWARLHSLAISERTTLQELMMRGLDRVFAEQGLPPMRRDGITK
jgi:hypothetical protein